MAVVLSWKLLFNTPAWHSILFSTQVPLHALFIPVLVGLCSYKYVLKIRRRRVSTTADLVEGGWGEVAVAMAGKLSLRYARDGVTAGLFQSLENVLKIQLKADSRTFACSLAGSRDCCLPSNKAMWVHFLKGKMHYLYKNYWLNIFIN